MNRYRTVRQNVAAPEQSNRLGLLVLVALFLVCAALRAGEKFVATQNVSPFMHVLPSTAAEIAYWAERDRLFKGGRFYKPLFDLVDMPGVSDPELVDASEVELPDSTDVIGIEVGGKAIAFDLQSMGKPERHIVNLLVDQQPISVTYCNLVDCVRVFKRRENSDSKQTEDSDAAERGVIPLRVGGLDIDRQMVLLLEGERYGQESPSIPLIDHPHRRTSLGQWKRLHPHTCIYLHGSSS